MVSTKVCVDALLHNTHKQQEQDKHCRQRICLYTQMHSRTLMHGCTYGCTQAHCIYTITCAGCNEVEKRLIAVGLDTDSGSVAAANEVLRIEIEECYLPQGENPHLHQIINLHLCTSDVINYIRYTAQ